MKNYYGFSNHLWRRTPVDGRRIAGTSGQVEKVQIRFGTEMKAVILQEEKAIFPPVIIHFRHVNTARLTRRIGRIEQTSWIAPHERWKDVRK